MRPLSKRFALLFAGALALSLPLWDANGSSHREAPLISNDPLADNTDLYAFRDPVDQNAITIIANYIPLELPEGGPNYSTFGEGIRYEIHIDNDASKPGDEITYRFTFTQTNEDPTTFFNIRLGKQNLKTTYTCEKSTDNGQTFTTIVTNGIVPPNNIGPRSIENPTVGLGKSYPQLVADAIVDATGGGGEKIFCGPVDDPFFVDLGGIFDVGNLRDSTGTKGEAPSKARDAVAGFNTHTISLKIPIDRLQKDGKGVGQAANILDGDYVIGVWASASRPRITTLSGTGEKPTYSSDYVLVSRLGMPLTNEAVIPIGMKDKWNAYSPYETPIELSYAPHFVNPELALYMDDSKFGGAVPGLSDLRIQTSSLGAFDFRNGAAGLSGLTTEQKAGTVFENPTYGPILLQPGNPRSVDLLPIFYTGVPNLRPYQLATGKDGNPLAAGKPFINNFLPSLGDMLRLNMAVPPTPRNDPNFNSLGLVYAAVLGLTQPQYANTNLEFIPNMDGFPNGRRLEDDVTRIELQAVSGVVLAAIGLWYDDYTPGQTPSPVTPQLLKVLGFNAGPVRNDLPFRTEWPYMAYPHRGYDYTKVLTTSVGRDEDPNSSTLNMMAPTGFFTRNYPNPTATSTKLNFHLAGNSQVEVAIFDVQGRKIATLVDGRFNRGDHEAEWNPEGSVAPGVYVARLVVDGASVASTKINVVK